MERASAKMSFRELGEVIFDYPKSVISVASAKTYFVVHDSSLDGSTD